METTEKRINNILEDIKEFKWKVIQLEIKDDNCIYGLVEKRNGFEWETLYTPSNRDTKPQETLDKLKDKLKI